MDNNYQIFISSTASDQIKTQLIKRNTPEAFIRIGVNGGSCNGFSYNIAFEDSGVKSKDLLFNIGGINVVIDNKSILYLNGITLDWNNSLMKQGFEIKNNNVKSTCGCGNSFNI